MCVDTFLPQTEHSEVSSVYMTDAQWFVLMRIMFGLDITEFQVRAALCESARG